MDDKTKKNKVEAADILGGEKTEEVSDSKNVAERTRFSRRDSKYPQWYVVNIQSGHEKSVLINLNQRIEATKSQDLIKDILIPMQKKIVVKKGKQEIKEERIFPGYILVKMVLTNRTVELVTNTEGVRGFVRTDSKPRSLPESEVKAIMKYMEVEQPAYQSSFSVGEAVKITDGAFADFIGSVKEIDDSKGKIKVLISFLGREAPVELDFSQVNKM
jgi:transcription termination/antitermination protein NusG